MERSSRGRGRLVCSLEQRAAGVSNRRATRRATSANVSGLRISHRVPRDAAREIRSAARRTNRDVIANSL